MSHQDRKSNGRTVVNHESLREVMGWLLRPALFVGMRVRVGSRWKPRMLAAAALLWATSDRQSLTERFEHARKIIKRVFRGQREPGSTYRGFMKMLSKWHAELLLVMLCELRLQMERELSNQYQVAGFTVFAGDGSRVETPRTASNQQAYVAGRSRTKKKPKRGPSQRVRREKATRKKKKQSAASIAKKASTTQMWLTLLWHVGTGLPWSWRSGASDSSERHHLIEMLLELPKNALITADAGFVGYEFWKTVLDSGHDFVIRVGANVKLLKKLGYAREYDQTVYLWPDEFARKLLAPLVLRLIVIHDGKQPVYLATSVLSKRRLSDRQAIEIYRRRWGIELFFRTFKQTFGRRKLRSHSAANAKLELDWSLVALWCVCLWGQRVLHRAGHSPTRLSAASAIKAVQTTMRDYRVRPESSAETLHSMLANARLDQYKRTSSKRSKNYPMKKRRERTSPPELVNASKQQINDANEVKQMEAKFRSAA